MKTMKRPLRTLSKVMLTSAISVSLLVPSAALAAEQGTIVPQKVDVVIDMSGKTAEVKAKPKYTEADAKITKDEAVERTRKLFPRLKDAEVRSVDFGMKNQMPRPDANVWSIDWELKMSNGGGHSFSTRIAADTGEIIDAYMPSFDSDRNKLFYPPKVTKEQALTLAKSLSYKPLTR
ncbi:hypothetical protein NV379_23905 [Paenibacillus sp. N1-5-1-14]|uniref:hypothetical protein n=1 Tax=Paenibacillus radicibacter TaxID=2972488 RepID=UPI002159690F|nr:hypothetical protein [Paenibacillus radicibacter]MCR8645690.1 hypothetical protein [Paenibacillus radicibacter]